MSEHKLPSRSEDFSEWYNQLILRAELADYAPVRGCMIVRPSGWALWELIQHALDRRFKATGHMNGVAQFIAVCSKGKSVVHIAKGTWKSPQSINFSDKITQLPGMKQLNIFQWISGILCVCIPDFPPLFFVFLRFYKLL